MYTILTLGIRNTKITIHFNYIAVSYSTAGLVYEVLICVNYASCHELANFNSAITLTLSFQLTVRATVPYL